ARGSDRPRPRLPDARPARGSDPGRESRVAARGDSLAAEEPGLERLQALLSRERPHVLAAAVPLGDGQVVLERVVRLLERVLELVALEDVVLGPRRPAVPALGIDGAAHGPERARLPLDPDDDALLVAGVVDSMEHP